MLGPRTVPRGSAMSDADLPSTTSGPTSGPTGGTAVVTPTVGAQLRAAREQFGGERHDSA